MPVPKFYELNRPLLELLADGRESTLGSVAEAIAKKLALSAEDLAETVPSGKSRFLDRLGWARSDLSRAGLMETVRRGVYRITDFGRSQLPGLPPVINRPFLIEQGWGEWGRTEKAGNQPRVILSSTANEDTPDERIDGALDELAEALAEEVLDRLKKLPPSSFERFVVELLKAMDYGIGEVTGRTGDGGIDGMIYEDRLHLDRIYLQAKRWTVDQPVRAPDINGFIGALNRKGATRGVFVTTSRYTKDAKTAADEVKNLRVKLIDGTELVKLAIEYNVGVSIKRKLEIKRLDSDYFDEFGEG
jgi:restriction system protein